jgi:CRISPR/Cas system-associated exonuclease Cas4 (RecB family)
MIRRSRLAERTFKRRFTAATGLAPIAYVQRLRIEDAKRRLERTGASVDEIARGLRRRRVLPPPLQAHHRTCARCVSQRFCIPDFARP